MQPGAAMPTPCRLKGDRCGRALREEHDVSFEFESQPRFNEGQPRYRQVSIGNPAVEGNPP